MSTQMNPQVSEAPAQPQPQAPVQAQAPVQPQPPVEPQAPIQPQAQAPAQPRFDRRLVAGVILIAFGALMLLATFVNSTLLGLSVLPMLGVLFIVWGLLARLPGLMIPGGILTGLGSGILLSQYAFGSATGEARGGIIVLGLGVGFLLIMPLISVISAEKHWWALIPGSILSVIGIALLLGGPALSVLDMLGKLWPVVPIIVGIVLIWQLFRRREQ